MLCAASSVSGRVTYNLSAGFSKHDTAFLLQYNVLSRYDLNRIASGTLIRR